MRSLDDVSGSVVTAASLKEARRSDGGPGRGWVSAVGATAASLKGGGI